MKPITLEITDDERFTIECALVCYERKLRDEGLWKTQLERVAAECIAPIRNKIAQAQKDAAGLFESG